MKRVVLLLILGLIQSALAAEPRLVDLRDLRVIDGKIYNPKRSDLWSQCTTEVLRVRTNGIVVQEFTIKEIRAPSRRSRVDSLASVGGFAGGGGGGSVWSGGQLLGTEKIRGKKIFLTNFPMQEHPRDGETIEALGYPRGTINIAGETMDLWDYGHRATPDELNEYHARIKAGAAQIGEEVSAVRQQEATDSEKKVVAFQIKRAAEGSSSALFDLGMRHLVGNGVDKDEALGKQMIKNAADQGYANAIKKLKTLP